LTIINSSVNRHFGLTSHFEEKGIHAMQTDHNFSSISKSCSQPSLVLLTGATGYIGGRLLTCLEAKGCRIRCLARKPEHLHHRQNRQVEIVQGNVLETDSLRTAMSNIQAAYYLIHSMASEGKFEEEDRKAAHYFGKAAKEAGVKRIIYLGGLGNPEENLSPHLKSRQEVGKILRESGVQVIEFRASVVIGSGSLSFEIIRALVERLPVMITPRWVSVPTQPICITDLLHYLMEALTQSVEGNPIFEIGGNDVVSYGDLMKEYAKQRGLTRLMLPVPVLTPSLSSLWLGLVTPVYARIGRKLIDSIRNPTIVQDAAAQRFFGIRPMNVSEAIATALRNEDHEIAETRWSDALSSAGIIREWGGTRFGTRLVDSRMDHVEVPPTVAFRPIRRIGGQTGWYYGNWLWKIRGWLDLLAGGVGLRRGRRDPENVYVGDPLDFWRVEQFEPDRLLRLAAEMKLPGRAWLQFEVQATEKGSQIRQTAIFDPHGLQGLLYWYLLYPIHLCVFGGMLKGIIRTARQEWKANE
jgi:uncharacterized protein YbjT (DUF2867 family)